MWFDTVLKSIIIILMWVGLWGLAELAIDAISGDNPILRAFTYIVLLIFGSICLYILDQPVINT